jgi:hypothetical protein
LTTPGLPALTSVESIVRPFLWKQQLRQPL